MKIIVAGVGYVGLSPAVLLAQKHKVAAITTMFNVQRWGQTPTW